MAARCYELVGVDPCDNLDHNHFVDKRFKTTIEQFHSETAFNLATLRMVAEHIEHPELVVESLAQLIAPKGIVVVYTPNKWSALSILARLVPNRWHAFFARLLSSNRNDEDVFPTCYKMNTRKRLREIFESGGFQELGFVYLDDCVVFQKFKVTYFLELAVWKAFRKFRLRYPENNLLGIYQKQ